MTFKVTKTKVGSLKILVMGEKDIEYMDTIIRYGAEISRLLSDTDNQDIEQQKNNPIDKKSEAYKTQWRLYYAWSKVRYEIKKYKSMLLLIFGKDIPPLEPEDFCRN